MTPQEYAKLQRDYLISTDKESALKMIAEFESLKQDISDYLISNAPREINAETLKEKNFLERILDAVEEKVDNLSSQASSIVARAQSKVVGFARNAFKKFLKEEKPEIETSIFEKDKEAIQKLIGRTQTGTTLDKSFQRLKAPIAEKAKAELIEGFTQGESHVQIAKRLTDAAELPRWQAMTIARTETNESYRAATREFYESAEIEKYIWMSVLDPRTCLICWYLHGKIFDSSKKVFSHPNCRCVLVPFTGQKVKTGEEIFKTLEPGFQKQILGSSRFELYEKNSKLADFVGTEETEEFGKKHFIKSVYDVEKPQAGDGTNYGKWKRYGKRFDPSGVLQESPVRCVSAVGELLLKQRGINNVTQKMILDIIGEPADEYALERALRHFDPDTSDGRVWRGISTNEKALDAVLAQKHVAVFLMDDFATNKLLHAVVINGSTDKGMIRVRDPQDQSKYRMTREEFLEHWGRQVIFRWFP